MISKSAVGVDTRVWRLISSLTFKEDILKTYNESSSDESESTNSPNVGSQIEELKVWCKNNHKSLDAIMIDHSTSYFAKLEKIISSDSIDHDVTKKLLQKYILKPPHFVNPTR